MSDEKKGKKPAKPTDKEKAEELTSLLQRLQAEFANFKRRTEEEKEDYTNAGKRQVFEKLIPVIDHFELALQHECQDENYATGMKMIHGLLIDMLGSEHVNILDPVGQEFDPNLHEAVGTTEEKSKDNNEVVEVQNKGYLLHDKIIRRARVVVNVNEEKSESND